MPTFANLVSQAKKKLIFFITKQLEKPSIIWLIVTAPVKLLVFFIIQIKKFRKLKKVQETCSVCVGNITLGGNGKTPFILKLIEDLNSFNPTVISKGYKRTLKGTFSLKESLDPRQLGDEPVLIKSKFSNADVYVTDNRFDFLEKFKPTLAIFDDGLQDSKLDYDFKIALFDKIRFFQAQNLVPQGLYREPFSSLKKVDLIGIKGEVLEDEFLKIKSYLLSKKIDKPLFSFLLKPKGFKSLNGFSFDTKKPVAVFCAIGNPMSFIQTLQILKVQIKDRFFLPDHEMMELEDLNKWIIKIKENQIDQIVCTEKDAIKLNCLENLSIALFSLETETILEHGIQEYQHFIEKLKRNIITTVKERDQSNG